VFVGRITCTESEANMPLGKLLSSTWHHIQGSLFPQLGEEVGPLPSKSTFSRAFADFALSALPARVHEGLIQTTRAERLVGHISARQRRDRSARPAAQG
jgi:hypothetical protein